MVRQCLAALPWVLTVAVVGFGAREVHSAGPGHGGGGGGGGGHGGGHGPGHGGGGGHILAARGPYGRGCGYYGPGRRYGYYGCPGIYGAGWGLGLGYPYGYGYPYPYPYGYDYPLYVDLNTGPPPAAFAQVGAVSGPVPPGTPFPSGPVRLTDSDVLLSIHAPPDAIIRINGTPTTQSGPHREFMSSGLSPGRTYTFVVTAHWNGSNGKGVDLERRLHVMGGERRNVDFIAPAVRKE